MNRPILFVINDLDRGGAERHLVQVLPALARCDLAPMVYTLIHKGELAAQLEAQRIPVIAPPLSAVVQRLPRFLQEVVILPFSWLGLVATLLTKRPRIVHFFLPAAYILGGLTSLMVPIGGRVMSRRSLRDYQLNHPILARVERWLHPRMTAVLGNSRAVVEQLRAEGVSEARLGLIYNGIDTSLYRGLPPRAELRQSLGIAETSLVLAMVANFIPYKGHEDLLHALASIKDALPLPWEILLVGGGNDYQHDIQKRACELGLERHVRYLGIRDDIPQILGASDIGILSSHQEGFSNSILEGMAAGLPMVVTDVGGNPEAVPDGETGFVVPAQAPAALAAAILRLAHDSDGRNRMGEAGRRRVETLFSHDACVAKYAALYDGLMDENSRPIAELIEAGAP